MTTDKKTYDLAILSHHKCATNWLRSICRELGKRKLIAVDTVGGQDRNTEIEGSEASKSVLLDVNAIYSPERRVDFSGQPSVHFVRDPRDAFVSNYWSWLRSHQNNNEEILKFREEAADLSVEEGMFKLIEPFPMAAQLKTWPDDAWKSVTTIRYEDLLEDFDTTLRAMFAPGRIALNGKVVELVREATDFRKITGREAGKEDVEHHFRKGVSGDWKNYFTTELNAAFMARHGWLGERLGYW